MRGGLARELVWAGAAIALFAAVYAVFVQGDLGRWFDDASLDGRVVFPPDGLRDAARPLTSLCIGLLAAGAAAAVVVALVRGRRGAALAAAGYVIAASVTAQILKDVLPRPPTPDPASLPSGHVTAAVSLAVAAAVLAPARLRPLAVAAGGALSAIVGVGVVASGAHRTSDVVASGLLCIAWAAVIRAGAALADRRPAGAAPGGVPWPALGAAVILWLPAVATLAAFVVAALIGTPLPEGTSDEGFYAIAWPVAATAPAAAVTTIVYLGLDPVAGLGPDSEARPSPAAAARGA